MTESDEAQVPPWVPVLQEISRLSGHELRNSLNALVVNLEVVRSRTSDPQIDPFVTQSVAQAEESVRLAEAAISLLGLVLSAVGGSGKVNAEFVSANGVRIKGDPGVADRAGRTLKALANRTTLVVDASESTVILTIASAAAASEKNSAISAPTHGPRLSE